MAEPETAPDQPSAPFVRIVDVSAWRDDDPARRAALLEDVDASLCELGFLVITNHGVDPGAAAAVRAAAGEFLALSPEVKAGYECDALGWPGWVPFGKEANGYIFGEDTPPDLKEGWVTNLGEIPDPDGEPRSHVVGTNRWPTETPDLRDAVLAYIGEVEQLHLELLAVLGTALGVGPGLLLDSGSSAASTFSINWYPPLVFTGEVAENQFRIGPHTDFGTITILDRQPGLGGLQIQTESGDWVDAPHEPGSLIINVGDLLEMWSGGRWRSSRHRVLPPTGEAPEESLMSLVYFCEPNAEVLISPMHGADGEPIGDRVFEPVRAADYLQSKLDQITVS